MEKEKQHMDINSDGHKVLKIKDWIKSKEEDDVTRYDYIIKEIVEAMIKTITDRGDEYVSFAIDDIITPEPGISITVFYLDDDKTQKVLNRILSFKALEEKRQQNLT